MQLKGENLLNLQIFYLLLNKFFNNINYRLNLINFIGAFKKTIKKRKGKTKNKRNFSIKNAW